MGLIRKHLEHLVSLLGALQNKGAFNNIKGFLESETFWFFYAAFFQKNLIVFFMLNTDNFFYSPLR